MRWCHAQTRLRKRARRAWNRATRVGPDPKLWLAYRIAQKEYKKELLDAKRRSWRDLWLTKFLRGTRRVQLGTIHWPCGAYSSSLYEALGCLLQTHYPGWTNPVDTHPLELPMVDQRFLSTIEEIVTEERIGKAINSFDSYKSPGCNRVYPIMLKRGGDVLVTLLTDLYRACLRLRHIPPCWSHARVALLPKAGKKSYQRAKDFRPITQTFFFLKTLERLVYWYLEGCGSCRPHPQQFAYRRGHSTDADRRAQYIIRSLPWVCSWISRGLSPTSHMRLSLMHMWKTTWCGR